MAEQQKHPIDSKLFFKGVDSDIESELIQPNSGLAIDACNARSSGGDGDNGSSKKIKGEEVVYPAIDNACFDGTFGPLSSSYFCLGTAYINRSKFEVWVDENAVLPPLFRIDGIIVARSFDIPFQKSFPLQLHWNETCPGGEVYLTDFNSQPMIFNIRDLRRNGGLEIGYSCTGKYFADFVYEEHVLSVKKSMDTLVFTDIISTPDADYVFQEDGIQGLPVGYYTYSIRYVTTSGDRTQWSQVTPQIPMTEGLGLSCSPTFPRIKTYSSEADLSVGTPNGIKLKLRINNELNFDFIEVRRTRWNAEDPLNSPPVSEICGVIDIDPGELKVVTIADFYGFEEALSDDESSDVLAAISRAKAIRYFERKLYLMNIEYVSKDIKAEDYELLAGERMSNCIRKIGKEGHSNHYHATYHKHLITLEKYGWAFIMWDDQGGYTFAEPIEGFGNSKQPHRRSVVSATERQTSYYGVPIAATVDGNVDEVWEVFDMKDSEKKTDVCSFFNISEEGSKSQANTNEYCATPGSFLNGFNRPDAGLIGYKPIGPTSHADGSCAGHNYRINPEVGDGATTSWKTYNPKGFAPNYYVHGKTFKGFKTIPEWCTGFSIVRTRPAGKVVAQGLGMYKLNSADGIIGSNTTKDKKKLWCFFPDLDQFTGISPEVVDDIKNNPLAYKMVAVSPLGFFTEVLSFRNDADVVDLDFGVDSGVDLVTYARIQREEYVSGTAQINPFENISMGIAGPSGRYVAYGKWRKDSALTTGVFANGANGEHEFTITDLDDEPQYAGRGNYFEITLNEDIYDSGSTGGNVYESSSVRSWHEPFYTITIVKINADVPTENIKQYVNTGHIQKIKSLIGISNGSLDQSFSIVDERWEDFAPFENAIPVSERSVSPYLNALERFIFIQDEGGNSFRWINVINKTIAEIEVILSDIDSNGFSQVTDSSGTYSVFGVYTHEETVDGLAPSFSIRFNIHSANYSTTGQIPQNKYKIFVRYDNRIPVRVFGGDGWVNESVWAPLDLKYGTDGDPVDGSNMFRINLPFPNRCYSVNPHVFIMNKTTGLNKIQSKYKFKFDNAVGGAPARIRQLINMFTCESRINLSFFYNVESQKHSIKQSYPKKHYVMRPYKYDPSPSDADFLNANNIHAGYEDDYGKEWVNWGYGGFRFLPNANLDYSKRNSDSRVITSTPLVGFTEVSQFCSRSVWSLPREVNQQNAPGIRTFLEQNYYDLPDLNGEIKLAYDSLVSNAGFNLYAFTNDGIAMMITDKRILTDADGDDSIVIASGGQGILGHRWISNDVGLNDEMWRSFAEFNNSAFFANKLGVYKLNNNQLQPILRKGYYSVLNPALQAFSPDYSDFMTAIFNPLHDEYMLTIMRGIQEGYHLINHGKIKKDGAQIVNTYPTWNEPQSLYEYQSYINVNPVSVVNLWTETPIPQQTGVYLGGTQGWLLTQDVIIHCLPSSPYGIVVIYRQAPGVVIETTVEPGEYKGFDSFYLPSTLNPHADVFPYFKPGEAIIPIPQSYFPNGCQTVRFGDSSDAWQGKSSHQYDKYLRASNDVFGMKDGITYKIDSGNILNGEIIVYELLASCTGSLGKAKEFIRIRVNSDNKPFKVRFYLDKSDAILDNAICELTDTQLKDRAGFENYIPRQTINRLRVQGRVLYYRIIHNFNEDFRVVSSDVQFKNLK